MSKSAGKTVGRVAKGVATGGLSEWQHGKNAFGVLPAAKSLLGMGGSSGSMSQMGMESPAAILAQSGGAPLLANIAMGANVNDAIAGYFGAGEYDSWYRGLSDEDKNLVSGVGKQLEAIQKNTTLRNQAVQQIVNDFPQIASKAAEARVQSGQEFDEVTKGYIDQALGKVGAKYAAGGMLSSGANAAAHARTAADIGLNKLEYMGQREQNAYGQGIDAWQARYNEANALRNFQNLMTGQAAGQGFSAHQAALQRNANAQQFNAGAQNQQRIQEQQNENALLGVLGGVSGSILGGGMLRNTMAGMYGGTGGTNYAIKPPTSYGSGSGWGQGPGFDTSQYAPR